VQCLFFLRDRDLTVTKLDKISIDPILITLDLSLLKSCASVLSERYLKTGCMEIQVQIMSTVKGEAPYHKTESLTIKGRYNRLKGCYYFIKDRP
jgi:hypothetical protein